MIESEDAEPTDVEGLLYKATVYKGLENPWILVYTMCVCVKEVVLEAIFHGVQGMIVYKDYLGPSSLF